MRSSLCAALATAVALTGCNGLLGLDFEPTDDVAAPDGAAPEPDAGEPEDAGSADAAPHDTGVSPGDAGIEAEQTRLAALRVRIADAPPLDRIFVSKSWLYWSTSGWQARRVPAADSRTFAFPVTSANDTHLATGPVFEDVALRDIAGTKLAEYPRDSPIAVDDGVVFFPEVTGAIEVLLWRASAPAGRAKIGTIATTAATTIGSSGQFVYRRDATTAGRLWLVDTAAPGVSTVTTTVTAQHATNTDDGIVVTHVAGAEMLFRLLTPSKEIDLTAEISTAASIVPPNERDAFGSAPVGFGPWLIFSARGGLLAYRHADARLVPIQIRRSTDAFVFNAPQVVRASRALAFTMSTPQGLFYAPLDTILPGT